MRRTGPANRAVIAIVIGVLLGSSGLALPARAASPSPSTATAPDPSDVVLVLDFSASILRDGANRNRFAAALEEIANRVDATSADLAAGDATMSIVQFATRAADVPGCVDLKLLNSPETVAHFADCLRSVAAAYRGGPNAALRARIGNDTNYVAAMEQAARHLPADAVRPAVILFSDGRHDVAGVPASAVAPARDRLFGSRSPFALLPVGMGLAANDRPALEAGLNALRITRDMPACVSGATFDWPQAVFDTPAEAGNAVAVALQEATCTFTVAPTPAPTPPPTLGGVRSIALTPGDARVEVVWVAPTVLPEPVVDYKVRCRAGNGEWIESTEGVSLERRTNLVGLTNGLDYTCEVAAVGATTQGPWTPASATVRPIGLPAIPPKPSVEAMDRGVRLSIPAVDPAAVTEIHYECSADGGQTWTSRVDTSTATNTTAQIGNLANGTSYVCRATAANSIGESDASPVSDAITPCAGLLECNGLLAPLVGILGVVLALALAAIFVAFLRERRRGYVLAVVDVIHTANIGRGARLGIGFVRAPGSRIVTDIVAEPWKSADVRIRQLSGDRFEVTDTAGRHEAKSGEAIVVVAGGVRHELVLRAFATNAASAVATRR